MKLTFKTILILAVLFSSILNGICQNRINIVHKDYIIKYERIEFHFEDSIYPFTVFIEPNGYFYFMTGFVEPSHPGMTSIRLDDNSPNVNYIDTFVLKSNKLLNIESYYPRLIKHDSSIINHYNHEMNLMKD